ncbi:LOW QUALITY PROTEIN: Hypothetical protein PHPALM_6112 [Phytophthora palmivora]|uniref:Uncharacterized protein n=1 Tax=Phytophthora palmivora TaxID=4796 RepID=A0A2P4YFM3_9STRA|nr:LOW QUALITY PROTEIN: Hypothetical protein PHPALM_6112 [Phytophthora palmivora]
MDGLKVSPSHPQLFRVHVNTIEELIQIALQEEYNHRQARTPTSVRQGHNVSTDAVQGAPAAGTSTGPVPMELGTDVQSSIRCCGCGHMQRACPEGGQRKFLFRPKGLNGQWPKPRPKSQGNSRGGAPYWRRFKSPWSAGGTRHGGLAPENLGALETRKISGRLLVVHASERAYGDPFRILIDSGVLTKCARRQAVELDFRSGQLEQDRTNKVFAYISNTICEDMKNRSLDIDNQVAEIFTAILILNFPVTSDRYPMSPLASRMRTYLFAENMTISCGIKRKFGSGLLEQMRVLLCECNMGCAVDGCQEADELKRDPCSVGGKLTHHLCAIGVFEGADSAPNERWASTPAAVSSTPDTSTYSRDPPPNIWAGSDSDFVPSPVLPADDTTATEERVSKLRKTSAASKAVKSKMKKAPSTKAGQPSTGLLLSTPTSPPASPVSELGVSLSVRHSQKDGTTDDVWDLVHSLDRPYTKRDPWKPSPVQYRNICIFHPSTDKDKPLQLGDTLRNTKHASHTKDHIKSKHADHL